MELLFLEMKGMDVLAAVGVPCLSSEAISPLVGRRRLVS
jgi:hypothetical protein